MLHMDGNFVYNKPVTGKNNIGRRGDISILGNLLSQSENVAIYEPEKTGKRSLIRQTFYNMRISSMQCCTVEFSLRNVSTIADYLLGLTDIDPSDEARKQRQRLTEEEQNEMHRYEEYLLWKRKK